MSDQQSSGLPAEVQDQLVEGSQQIFMTAFNSAQDDGMSKETALNVAWNTVKNDYQQGEDGKWHRKPEGSNANLSKGVQSGGN